MHKFLSLRLGVMIIAGLTFLGSVFIAAVGWINVKDILNHSLVLILPHQRLVWISAGISTLTALISLFGLFAAFKARVNLVEAFNLMQLTSLGFSLLFVGFIALSELYSKEYDDEVGVNCKNTEDAATMCRTNVTRGTISGILYLIWLTQFRTIIWLEYLVAHKYSPTDGLFIVHGYVEELRRKSPSVNFVAVKLQDMSASVPYSPA
ncbi:uncharacterized protein ARMOST_12056 [Armillaria ostoyae]|uniref:MARVEL domain-containing protein n=1 Tax=Armillaria ostoyae TaxID=47428 RepID=A0A284RJ04_ARMOS|nr:uncharacterized protein ARMOST_12056 [Armillaria ostoyae]